MRCACLVLSPLSKSTVRRLLGASTEAKDSRNKSGASLQLPRCSNGGTVNKQFHVCSIRGVKNMRYWLWIGRALALSITQCRAHTAACLDQNSKHIWVRSSGIIYSALYKTALSTWIYRNNLYTLCSADLFINAELEKTFSRHSAAEQEENVSYLVGRNGFKQQPVSTPQGLN